MSPSTSGITIAAMVPPLDPSRSLDALPDASWASAGSVGVVVTVGCVVAVLSSVGSGVALVGVATLVVSLVVLIGLVVLVGRSGSAGHGQRVSVGADSATSTGPTVGAVSLVVAGA